MNLVSSQLGKKKKRVVFFPVTLGIWESRAKPSQPLPSIANRVECLLVQEFVLLKSLHKHRVEKYCLLERMQKQRTNWFFPEVETLLCRL